MLVVPSSVVYAAGDPAGLRVQRSRTAGLANFVTQVEHGPIPAANATQSVATPEQFFREYGRLFGITDSTRQLVAERPQKDRLGWLHTSFRQVHGGVPVFSGMLRVHENEFGQVVAVNGDFYPIRSKLRLVATLSAEQAAAVAATHLDSANFVLDRADLVIVDPGWYGDPPIGEHLAYHVELSDESRGVFEAFFVDAHNGKVLDQWSLRHTARQRVIYDGAGESALPGVLARTEGDGPVTGPQDVNRAYDYLGDVYDYYRRAFGRDAPDGAGLALLASVNSTAPGCPNAFWSSRRRQTVYCEETVTDDIVAHEVTHAVTYFTADLIYQNQAGQLNESFSDVFGELVDLFNGDGAFLDSLADPLWPDHPTGAGLDAPNRRRTSCSPSPDHPDGVRWLIAEEAQPFGGWIRDMWAPICRGDPDRANSPLQTCSGIDNGGVHSGSGIPNHAFAILTDGKTFNGYTVRGVGPIKAGAVWYRALATYLTVASDFGDAFHAINQAAADLIGAFPLDPRTGLPSTNVFTADDAAQVEMALRAVEMNTPGRCGQTLSLLDPNPPPQCPHKTVVFADDFENGVHGWTVSNSNPPTPYDWERTTATLPFGREGAAWFCDDPDLGDCDKQDESAVHSLVSPPIFLAGDDGRLLLSFTHYLAAETSWDGGNVSIRVNDGAWRLIPGSAMLFNPYTGALRSEAYGNSNPMKSREAWSGAGGGWGTTLVDLGGLAPRFGTIQIRFDFGKDGCTGTRGWFVDDVELFFCPDCNLNGLPDHQETLFTASSGVLTPIGVGAAPTYRLVAPPQAISDVRIRLSASADLSRAEEWIEVSLNGESLGTVFATGAVDCPAIPDRADLVLSAETFNALVHEGDAVFLFTASPEMNPDLCGGNTFVGLFVEYTTVDGDDDDNDIPDYCENCAVPASPLVPVQAAASNRYLALTPGNAGRRVALQLRLPRTPPSPENLNAVAWVGESFSVASPNGQSPTWFAPLSCGPVFTDWSSLETVHIFGDLIQPGGTYTIAALDLACLPFRRRDFVVPAAVPGDAYFSANATVTTSARWGDVVGADNPHLLDGSTDSADLAAVLDAFRGAISAPPHYRADLAPAVPNQIVDSIDIVVLLDAVSGRPYPYVPRRPCR